MTHDPISIVPSYSITPSKVSSFNSVYFLNKIAKDGSAVYSRSRNRPAVLRSTPPAIKITKQFHNFEISSNAYRTLKRKINWLYYLAKKKEITTYRGNKLYNFKCCFLTLTLPSKQEHCTKDLNNLLLNPFLTELRKRLDMKNYVWRLEFQKNGNAHYHLVTDTYIDYHFALKLWNNHLKKLGYIKAYSEQMRSLSLLDYHKKYSDKYGNNFSLSKVRYNKGVASNWEQPNTVDTKSVIGDKNIASYLSKYFAKNPQGGSISNELDNEDNSKSIRLWFCSRSLSKLNTVSGIIGDMFVDVVAMAKSITSCKRVISKHCISYYFNFKKMAVSYKTVINKILTQYAYDQGYYKPT